MPLNGNPADWSRETQQGAIRDYLLAAGNGPHSDRDCPTCNAAYAALRPELGKAPLVFFRNATAWEKSQGQTARVELPAGKPRGRRALNKVREVHAFMAEPTPRQIPEPAPMPEPAPEPEPIPPYVPPVPGTFADDAERFYAAALKARAFVRSRKRPDGKPMESLDSMRLVIDGVKALQAGVPIEGLIGSITATWAAETIAQFERYMPQPEDLKPITPAGFDYAGFAPRPSAFAHAVSEYVHRLVKANVPVWLHGPAGTGKSSAAKYAAEQLGLDYYEVNLAGAMVSAVKGKDRLKAFVESEFMQAYRSGGVVVLEELDAAHPTVVTAINNAIANDAFHNDALGPEPIQRHSEFRVVATANTLGTGATVEFNSRMKLDGATLDRFRMGRVYVGLDMGLERTIFESMVAA